MFSRTHLLAAQFAADENTRYKFRKLQLTRDGKAIATTGKYAVVVSGLNLQEKLRKETALIDKDVALGFAEMIEGKHFTVSDCGNDTFILYDGKTTITLKEDKGDFPDVAASTDEANNPKKRENCASAYVNLELLKTCIDALVKMTKKDSAVELFVARKEGEDRRLGLRIEAMGKGLNGEDIVVTLMEMMKYK